MEDSSSSSVGLYLLNAATVPPCFAQVSQAVADLSHVGLTDMETLPSHWNT